MLTPRPLSTITTVAHYKDAAERHLQVCDILVQQLEDLRNAADTNKYYNVLAELYYLSGYVVECTINYKYLICKGCSDSQDSSLRARWDTDVDLKEHFRFSKSYAKNSSEKILNVLECSEYPSMLPIYLRSLGNITTPTLTTDEMVQKKMQRSWDPSIRYAYESTGLAFHATTSANDIKIYYKAARYLFYNLI